MPIRPPHVASISLKLPVDILERICSAALVIGEPSSAPSPAHDSSPLALLVLDSSWHKACSRVIYRQLVLEDDDELLLLAAAAAALDRETDAGSLPAGNRNSRSLKVVERLRAIAASQVYADSVRVLQIVPGRQAWRDPSPTLSLDTLAEVSTIPADAPTG